MRIEIPGIESPLQNDAGHLSVELRREHDILAGASGFENVQQAMGVDIVGRAGLVNIESFEQLHFILPGGIGDLLRHNRTFLTAAYGYQHACKRPGIEGIHDRAYKMHTGAQIEQKVGMIGEPRRISNLDIQMAQALSGNGIPCHDHGVANLHATDQKALVIHIGHGRIG